MPKELKPLIIPFFLWWRHKKKESIGYIGFTIRERNKNNAKYYIGAYSHLVSSKLDEVFLSALRRLTAMRCIFGQKRLPWQSFYIEIATTKPIAGIWMPMPAFSYFNFYKLFRHIKGVRVKRRFLSNLRSVKYLPLFYLNYFHTWWIT